MYAVYRKGAGTAQTFTGGRRHSKALDSRDFNEADDGPRTRDLRLGKPTLYQLSYTRSGFHIL